MAQVTVYKTDGTKSGTIKLPAEVFAVTPKAELVHQAYVTLLANTRQNIAHTKIRSERRGGGAKPWRQKGTGRARAGSRRSPIWKGGGITFGPRKDRNFGKQMNVKARRKALCMVLTERVNTDKFVVVDKLELAKPKTKEFAGQLEKLPVADNTVLLVLSGAKTDNNLYLAARNLSGVGIIRADSLNIKDLLGYEYILLARESIDIIVKTFGKTKGAVAKAKVKKVPSVKKTTKATKAKAVKKKTTKK
jgi:large subunit ribosomal protein L4